jgi:hypothetical protein
MLREGAVHRKVAGLRWIRPALWEWLFKAGCENMEEGLWVELRERGFLKQNCPG